MRVLETASVAGFLVAAILGPSQALAFSYSMIARTPTQDLQGGDSVVVDVFFTADQTGLVLASVAVLADDVMSFDTAASDLLPVIYPAPPASSGTTGAAPGQFLYSPAGAGLPELFMEPVRSPWVEWPGEKPPGTIQLNLDYWINDLIGGHSTHVTGSDLWIGSLVLDIEQDFGTAQVELALTSANVIGLYVDGEYREVDFTDIQLGDPVVLLSSPLLLTGLVPEPSTAVLLGFGIATACAGRRRSDR